MSHDPPAEYRFNKLRDVSGSFRLTLVKAAVDAAGIDAGPPRPTFAHIPAGEGVWLGFDVARHEAQLARVRVRAAVTDALDPAAPIVGEFPVALRGKLGSVVTRVPKGLADRTGIGSDAKLTAVAVVPGVVLFASESAITDTGTAIDAAIEAAGDAVAEHGP